MHILVIDDELDFLELISDRLKKRGFTVATAPNGTLGLEQVQAGEFDAVVLDVKMPGIDGIEVLRRIKEIRPHLGVVLLTGHASVESAMTGVEMGAVDYLLKPASLNDLITQLRRIEARKA